MELKKIVVATMLAVACLATEVSSASLAKLEKLVMSRKNSEAYTLASKMMSKEVGNPRFDFLYGMAALYSGKPQQATFSFERVLILQPRNLRARLELALAYFMMKNYDLAQREFAKVLQARPPKSVQANIQHFLNLIKLAKTSKQRGTKKYVRLGVKSGFDSNINTATAASAIQIPIFGSVTLDNTSREFPSSFVEGYINPGFMVSLGKKTTFFANIYASGRRNLRLSRYDTDMASFTAGLVYRFDKKNQVTIPVVYNRMFLENVDANFRTLVSTAVKFTHTVNPKNRLSTYFELNNMVFQRNPLSNTMLRLAGFEWGHVFTKARTKLDTKLYGGRDKASNLAASFNSRWLWGALASASWFPKGKAYNPYARVEYQRSMYDTVNNLISARREADLYDGTLGVKWRLPKGWIMDTQYRYTFSHANAALYQWRRSMATVGFDKTFG